MITDRSGRHVDAGAIVMGLARDLGSDHIDLPGFPDVVVRIQRTLADDRAGIKDVVKLVASEPLLAARLLQLANSAAFNKSGRKMSDLKAALNGLGVNIVRSQATAFAMRRMERVDWLRPVGPVVGDIWRTSNSVASLCFAVAKRVPGVQPDEAVAAGLFHLIGRLYLSVRACQENIDPAAVPDWEHTLDDWHATIARTILDHWRIPERVAEAVENQNAIFETDNSDLSPLSRILGATRLHQRLSRPGAPPEPEAGEVLARVQFSGARFEDLIHAARSDVQATAAVLG